TPDRFNESFPIDLQVLINQTGIEIEKLPLYLASVVPSQTEIWQQLAQVKVINLDLIPLHNLYPTLGIDRALATFGAGEIYGYPVLVIDGGTALTITGIDDRRCLLGGAILPGLRLQICSLFTGTAALPEIALPSQLPPRWSDNTSDSIASGILHTVSAGVSKFIYEWRQLFPDSQIAFTGGDGDLLMKYLKLDRSERMTYDRQLLFHGIVALLQGCIL
ncbi:pantothenate kinase, partial [Chamaesiphon sp. VAR_69_metabat_338]|uniref:pantothenate kinase n=1 Tax=Chamaesiphon sp. VAR_69_metabat_338 TaxID=2964704 RepID=UPI00286E4325